VARTAGKHRSARQREATATGRPLSALSDEELLEGIRRSSEMHFTELYERYFRRIFGFVYTRVGNRADAEEIAQETFVAVFRSLESYRGQSTLLSWIYGIAKNTVNNAMRRARTQSQRLEDMGPEELGPSRSLESCNPEERLSLHRCADAIGEQLASVAEWQSEIFVMRHVHDLSIREISERTERSSDAIRSSLYRVKRLLVEAAGMNLAAGSP
jgi:RNA polymerase sigma-70 factor (ECF subfamily)